MADDYGGDDDCVEYGDDAWFYIEDEFDLADELAEGQFPDPGYSGTNAEISMIAWDFDLFGYAEDLEYGDDPYWDYDGLAHTRQDAGQKRKREAPKKPAAKDKRVKMESPRNRDLEPVLFHSRASRLQAYFKSPPLATPRKATSFMGDWRERFANADGIVTNKKMPADMRKAAEAQDQDTPTKDGQLGKDMDMLGDGGNEDGGVWEDEDGDEGEAGEGLAIDTEMLKTILRERLGAEGLDGMDEDAFMETITKMLSGEGDGDEAAGLLANSLLGKVTSGNGDGALSGWLSQKGISLEEDDEDASSVGTTEQSLNDTRATHISLARKADQADGTSKQIAHHRGSPVSSTKKKRPAPDGVDLPNKKSKKVTFDVAPSSSPQSDIPTNDSKTSAGPILEGARAENPSAAQANRTATHGELGSEPDGEIDEDGAATNGIKKTMRKRKAASTESAEDKPAGKKARSRELQALGPPPSTPSPGPPARRTRNARAKAGK